MTLNQALLILMQAAVNDALGTTEDWREKLSEAWAIAHRRAYGWDPTEADYRKAGMTPYPGNEGAPTADTRHVPGRAKGGYARAASLSPERRSEIARNAVLARNKRRDKG